MKFAAIVTTASKVLRNNPRQTMMLWGAPGNGKSSCGQAIADALEVPLFMFRPSNKDATDITGLPTVHHDANTTSWALNQMWLDLNNAAERHGGALLLLDEINQANNMMFNAINGIILDRLVGDSFQLHPKVMVVATGNRTSDKAASNRMPSHTSNRMMHFDMESDLDGWCEAALTGKFASGPVQVPVVAFLRFRPHFLNKFDTDARSCPTERTWEMVSASTDPAMALTEGEEFAVVSGLVGEGVAAEYCGFKRIMDNMDNPDAILLDPKGFKPVTDPATSYAMMGAMASRSSKDNVERVWEYINQYPKDLQVVWLKDASTQHKGIRSTKTFTQIVTALKDVLF